MKHSICTLLIVSCVWFLPTNAQTPYDSFAPETSRPMLGIVENSSVDMINKSLTANATPTTDNIRKWLSVDPLADKYPNISPYAYCGWSPVKYVDPNGEDWYDSGEGSIVWDDKAISQDAMSKAGIRGVYLGKNVLVGKHGRDANLNEKINVAVFELYLDTYKEGPIASINGNTIPCDVDKYGTLKEGLYPAEYYEYKGRPAILINGGRDLPTVRGNPNNKKNYIDYDKKIMLPKEQQIMNQIFFHFGNNFFDGLKDSHGNPWSTGCQTGGNYKGAWSDYNNFMQKVPITFNGWYYLRSR